MVRVLFLLFTLEVGKRDLLIQSMQVQVLLL